MMADLPALLSPSTTTEHRILLAIFFLFAMAAAKATRRRGREGIAITAAGPSDQSRSRIERILRLSDLILGRILDL